MFTIYYTQNIPDIEVQERGRPHNRPDIQQTTDKLRLEMGINDEFTQMSDQICGQ